MSTPFEAVIDDLTTSLAPYFPLQYPDGDGPTIEADLTSDGVADGVVALSEGLLLAGSNDTVQAFPWRYHAIDRLGVHGLAPSHKPVVIRGMTVRYLGSGGNPDRFFRYIDWLDAYAQCGHSMISRTPVTPPAQTP